MKDSRDELPDAPFPEDNALKPVPAAASGDSGARDDPGSIDIVDAEVVSDPRPERKGRQGAALRRGREKKRVRGYETRRRLIDLHVFGGKRLVECARELGISYGRAHAVWRGVVAQAHGARGTKDEHMQAVRGYLDCYYRRLIEESQPRLAEGAAYGAVVVQACKALADLHDLKAENPQTQGLTLEDVGREVRVVSPLLLDRLDQISKMNGHADAQPQPDALGITVGGIAVEGVVQESAGSAEAKSPLLEGTAAERMLRSLERDGDRIVQRAQLEGSDAALDSMPAKRKPGDDGQQGTK